MDLLHGAERIIGYILLIVALPTFISLYALFSSHAVPASFFQGFSSTILTLTGSSLIASIAGLFVSSTGLFILGVLSLVGAVLVLWGGKGYTGMSKIGTEMLVISILSISAVYIFTDFILPRLVSSLASSVLKSISTASITNLIQSLLSPITSQLLYVNVFFMVFGAVLIALRFVLPRVTPLLMARRAQSPKKAVAQHAEFFWYKKVAVPVGATAMLVLLVVVTLFGAQAFTGLSYNTAPSPQNNVSLAYKSATSTAKILNLSDYYFLKSVNANTSYLGNITLSIPLAPVSFASPTSLSVTKFDPIRLDFGIDLSRLSSFFSSFGGNMSVPNALRFSQLYNASGAFRCTSTRNSSGISSQCSFQPLVENISKILLNITNSDVGVSIIGQMFAVANLPAMLFSGPSLNYTSLLSYFPNLVYVNHVTYKGNNCTLFNMTGTYLSFNVTGQLCIADSDGLPTFMYVNELNSGTGPGLNLLINFGAGSANTAVTLTDVNSFPPGTRFSSGVSGPFG